MITFSNILCFVFVPLSSFACIKQQKQGLHCLHQASNDNDNNFIVYYLSICLCPIRIRYPSCLLRILLLLVAQAKGGQARQWEAGGSPYVELRDNLATVFFFCTLSLAVDFSL